MMSTCEFNAIATIGGEMYKKNASQGIVDVYKLFHTSLTVELCWNLNIILMSIFQLRLFLAMWSAWWLKNMQSPYFLLL